MELENWVGSLPIVRIAQHGLVARSALINCVAVGSATNVPARSSVATPLIPLFKPAPGPTPRSVQLGDTKSRPLPVILNTPAVSWTTWFAGHPFNAAWMAAVSSPPLGESVLKMVVLFGMPPLFV